VEQWVERLVQSFYPYVRDFISATMSVKGLRGKFVLRIVNKAENEIIVSGHFN
jgi:hypothetical protein